MLAIVGDKHLSTGRNVPDPSTKPSDTATETCPTSEPALRAIAMPADTNPHGDIFGGWLLVPDGPRRLDLRHPARQRPRRDRRHYRPWRFIVRL